MSDYTVEYYSGGTWLRVTRDGDVIHEGDCRLSAWAVADILAPLGRVEVRPAPGGSWAERESGIATGLDPNVRVEYKANTTTWVIGVDTDKTTSPRPLA
jgi:hypothetical protein